MKYVDKEKVLEIVEKIRENSYINQQEDISRSEIGDAIYHGERISLRDMAQLIQNLPEVCPQQVSESLKVEEKVLEDKEKMIEVSEDIYIMDDGFYYYFDGNKQYCGKFKTKEEAGQALKQMQEGE